MFGESEADILSLHNHSQQLPCSATDIYISCAGPSATTAAAASRKSGGAQAVRSHEGHRTVEQQPNPMTGGAAFKAGETGFAFAQLRFVRLEIHRKTGLQA
jgi:hypothetical protein